MPFFVFAGAVEMFLMGFLQVSLPPVLCVRCLL